MTLKRKQKITAAATAIIIAGTSIAFANGTAATAQEATIYDAKLIESVGGPERINFSGKLRMLSQRIPAAACNLQASVNPDASAKILEAATVEFEQILNALENGDESLGIIGEETRRKTLAALGKLNETWAPIDEAARTIIDRGPDPELTRVLADRNDALLDAAKLLVSEISGQYADPAALLQADALRIDIAGRQRMLSQRMSKEACLVLSDINAEASLESMGKTVNMFDVSLTALRMGMPAAGIKASSDASIVAGLDLVAADWTSFKPLMDDLAAGGTWDADTRVKVFEGLNTLLVNMNKVVGMYTDESKLDI